MRENAKKFWYFISKNKLTVPSAAVILGSTYLVSNILGVVRERMIAAQFGASHLTDIFYASFKIPDLIFNLLVLGAVSSAFIPIYIDYLSDKKKDESNYVASNFMNFLLIFTIIFGVLIYGLAWKLVPILLPGFFKDGLAADFNTYEVTVRSVRIMLLSPIIFAISSVLGGILNSHKRFFAYALAPVVYNLSIIAGIYFFTDKTNPPVYGLLWGVIIGAILHAAIQIVPTFLAGFRWKPVLNFRKYELPKIIKLTVPRIAALGAQQVNILMDALVASYFIGGITVLNLANNIQTVPTVIFAIAIATAVFPLLSEQNSKKMQKEFKHTFSESLRKILYFMIPASVGLFVLRAQTVRLLYGVGEFSWESTIWTARALGYFSLGLVAQGVIPLLLKAFYALKNTKIPFYVSVITMIVNVVFAVILPFYTNMGVSGVALAFTIAGFVNAGLLYYFLEKEMGALDKENKIFATGIKLVLTSLFMGLMVYYSLRVFDTFLDTHTVIGLGLQTLGAISIGAFTYFGITHYLEINDVGGIFKKSV